MREPIANEGLHDGEFSVWVFFKPDDDSPDDAWHAADLEHVDGKTAVERAKRLSEGVGARTGMIARIIITDGGDNTVFQWEHGKGVTWPAWSAEKGQYAYPDGVDER